MGCTSSAAASSDHHEQEVVELKPQANLLTDKQTISNPKINISECKTLRETLPDFGWANNEAFIEHLSGKMGNMTDEEIAYFVIVCFGYYNHIYAWLGMQSFERIAKIIRLWMTKREIIELTRADIEFLTCICDVDKYSFLRNDKDENPEILNLAKQFLKDNGKEKLLLISTIGDGDQIDFENNRILKYYQGDEGPDTKYDTNYYTESVSCTQPEYESKVNNPKTTKIHVKSGQYDKFWKKKRMFDSMTSRIFASEKCLLRYKFIYNQRRCARFRDLFEVRFLILCFADFLLELCFVF